MWAAPWPTVALGPSVRPPVSEVSFVEGKRGKKMTLKSKGGRPGGWDLLTALSWEAWRVA